MGHPLKPQPTGQNRPTCCLSAPARPGRIDRWTSSRRIDRHRTRSRDTGRRDKPRKPLHPRPRPDLVDDAEPIGRNADHADHLAGGSLPELCPHGIEQPNGRSAPARHRAPARANPQPTAPNMKPAAHGIPLICLGFIPFSARAVTGFKPSRRMKTGQLHRPAQAFPRPVRFAAPSGRCWPGPGRNPRNPASGDPSGDLGPTPEAPGRTAPGIG